MCCQKNLFTKTAVGEFAIGLERVISCELVKVETESRNFSASEAQLGYKLYSKNCLTKIDKTKVLKTNDSLMRVENIAECSLGAFCNTFDLH